MRSAKGPLKMSSAASAIEAPPLCLNRSPTWRTASALPVAGRLAGPGAMRVGVVFAVVLAARLGLQVGGTKGQLGVLEAHGGERQLDDGGLVDGVDAVGRDALGEQEAASSSVGLGDRGCRRIPGSLVGELGVLDLLRLQERLLGPLPGRRRCRPGRGALASASRVSSSWRCCMSRRPRPGPSRPASSSRPATTGRQRPAGRPGRSAATSRPPARRRRWRAWATRMASSRSFGRLAGLLVNEVDALLLVLARARAAARLGHLPRPPCRRRSRSRAASSAPRFPLRQLRRAGLRSLRARLCEGSSCEALRVGAAVRGAAVGVSRDLRRRIIRTATISRMASCRIPTEFSNGVSFGGHTGSPSADRGVP